MSSSDRMTGSIYWLAKILATALAFWIISIGGGALSIILFIMGAGDGTIAAVNLGISIFTMAIAQANLVDSRRQDLASDYKLDCLIERAPGDNQALGVEHLSADEIKSMKDFLERRANDFSSNT